MRQQERGRCLHSVLSQETERWMLALCLSSFCSTQDPTLEVPHDIQARSQVAVDLLWKHPPRHALAFLSVGILKQVSLKGRFTTTSGML